MEVHHHSHTKRKKWIDYFWEFLMLFLAVFCGFLAEYQLEHTIEHQREKQFVKTLLEDIQSDQMNQKGAFDLFAVITNHIDSLTIQLKDKENLNKNASIIYRHAVWLHDYWKITYHDRTIEQLKNSGNFRLIRNKTVSRGIMDYDGAMINNAMDMQDNYVFQRKEKLLDLCNSVFNVKIIKNWFLNNYGSNQVDLIDSPLFLITESNVIDRLINELNQYSLTISWFSRNLNEWIMPKAIYLDSLIRKEYHLK